MAASLSDLKTQIEEAERAVHAVDARASEGIRSLKAHWRSRLPTIAIGAGSALLAFLLVRGRGRSRRRQFAEGGGNSWAGLLQQVMKLGGPRLFTLISALVAGFVQKKSQKPLVTAPSVDLQRYCGTWYEIARLPEKYEKDCASDVTATYEMTIDGGLRVVNRCKRRDGSVKRAIGRAEVADLDTNAKLRVTFAPQLLDALPFVWADYYIMDIASDYSTAVVGTPDRSHLWLLAREPTVDEEVRSAFIAKALGQGFDTSSLVYGRHTGAKEAGAAETGSFDSAGVQPSSGTPAPETTSASASASTTPTAQSIPATDYDRIDERLSEFDRAASEKQH